MWWMMGEGGGHYCSKKTDDICGDVCGQVFLSRNIVLFFFFFVFAGRGKGFRWNPLDLFIELCSSETN